MYYWHGRKLRDSLQQLSDIESITIATAYLSNDGLKTLNAIIVANKVSKENVKVYLSPEFSFDHPGSLLEELTTLANVFMVMGPKFHPKVYLFEGTKNQLIFGSSNLTRGGVEANIEFDLISDINNADALIIKTFFDFCNNNSIKITDDIINKYKEQTNEFEKLKNTHKQLIDQIFAFTKVDDQFSESDYELEEYYFDYNDYETLFPRNAIRSDSEIMKQRRRIKDKLLAIHNTAYPTIKKLNLNCHWYSPNITSLINKSKYNNGRVGWIGVRYGKSKSEIELLNTDTTSQEEDFGFPKHACLQFCLTSVGFEIYLFHAVRHDAVDRGYLHDRLYDTSFVKEIGEEVKTLKGNGLVWVIGDNEFRFDMNPSDKFISFIRQHDRDGEQSYLYYYVEPDDKRLINISSISKLVINKIKMLLPLYELMAFRPKY